MTRKWVHDVQEVTAPVVMCFAGARVACQSRVVDMQIVAFLVDC